ncbi:MAG: asparagine synthase C-terminal domain-containing protein, partial [candidate division Zixibacteria bacterium]|nr:asparagine synthase C-terminal domain-containing protein [candidate division Zixibacteria bacterium]
GRASTGRYWTMSYPETFDRQRPVASWAEELHALMVDAVRLRLRADVPVGAYLSGGLDSSVTTALIKHFTTTKLETFSIAFHDRAYDESEYQTQMADYLGTSHHVVRCDYHDIADHFPEVIWHTERPIVRTAPTPLYMLSNLVRENDFKVVLTGEGSDEILAGYDIFKETLIRSFWARNPESKWRPALLKKLYPTLPVSAANTGYYLQAFYKAGLAETEKYYFSHIPRMNTTTKIKDFFSGEVKDRIGGYDSLAAFGRDLPEGFFRWHQMVRAQYVEARSLLAGYILSSQGDRMSAAHSVEGRFPFLDHRVAEFAATIPPWLKIFGLNEKYILKKAMVKELPPNIIERVKQPYMAPDANSFVQADSPGYVREIMSAGSIKAGGIFNPITVGKLHDKCRRMAQKRLSFKDNMSFIGVLSTQLLIDKYIDHFEPPPCPARDAFTVWEDMSETGC